VLRPGGATKSAGESKGDVSSSELRMPAGSTILSRLEERNRACVHGPIRAARALRSDRTTVLLVEGHLALRKGLELLLRTSGIDLAGVAGTTDEGCRMSMDRRPDVTVVDGALGLSAVERILRFDPDAGVVLYTGLADREEIEAAAGWGVRGFALKDGGSDELIAAITAVAGGGVYVDPAVSALLKGSEPSDVLTVREREILQLLAGGLTGERSAELLFLSPETVRTHIRNAMRKLSASTRVHAVALALSLGEISQPAPAGRS
jgi:DNA-binding NarL/FixJ family response regulator